VRVNLPGGPWLTIGDGPLALSLSGGRKTRRQARYAASAEPLVTTPRHSWASSRTIFLELSQRGLTRCRAQCYSCASHKLCGGNGILGEGVLVATETRTVTVVGPSVPTNPPLFVDGGDTLFVRSSGEIDFGAGWFGGLFAPVLPADGDSWRTPDNYPAPLLRKNSLLVEVRPTTGAPGQFFQGGTSTGILIPPALNGEVFLQANDADPTDNSRGWTVELTRVFPDAGTPPVLQIERIEAVQTIQRADNSVPLIAGKPVTIRVFATSGTNMPVDGVGGSITVLDAAGRSFHVGAWSAGGSASRVAALPPGSHDRNRADSSLNFVLPGVQPRGQLQVTAEVFSTSPAMSATATRTFEFIDGPSLTIRPYLVQLAFEGISAPTAAQATGALQRALSRMPLAALFSSSPTVNVLPFISYTYPQQISDPFGLGMRALMYNISFVGSGIDPWNTFHVGFFRQPPLAPWAGMGIYRPFVAVPSCVTAISGNAAFDADTCAHELSHCFGLNHVDHPQCGGGVPWSYQLPDMTEEPGWDSSRQTIVPRGTAEMMSYCNPRWPSIVAYEWIRTHA
jgi:hypothetical protein